MKRVLIVSPSFPPINAPDMQRVRMSLPHYRPCGWEPVVLAVDPLCHGGRMEDNLLGTVPPGTKIHRVRALPLAVTRWFGLGNLGWRSWWSLLFAGAKIIRREKIDLVFFSNTQFVTFTLGRIWHRWLGVPYAIDLQDPWLTDYYTGPRRKERPGGWKYDVAHFQAKHLERWSFRRAAALMSVSPNYIADLRARYSWFSNVPAETIGFGASEDDFAFARKLAPSTAPSSKPVRIVSTGAAGPIMQPALRVLFDALSSLPETPGPDALRLEFLGTSYADRGEPTVLPLAASLGIGSIVSETPSRLGLLESLRAQLDAHALLLLGSADPAYSASKLFPYFLSGRPVLAIVLGGSVLERQLNELAFATVVPFDVQGATSTTRRQIQTFVQAALAGFPSAPAARRNEELFRREHLAPSLAARQCALFERACISTSA